MSILTTKSGRDKNPFAILGTMGKFTANLHHRGVTPEMIYAVNRNASKTDNLAHYLKRGCPQINDNGEVVKNQLPEGHNLARLILGDDFITPKEVATAYNVTYSDDQLEHFATTFPTLEKIVWCKSNKAILIPGFVRDLNLLETRELDNKLFRSNTEGWYAEDKQKFSRDDKVTAGEWLMIRKEAVPSSFSKTWKKQQTLITEDEYVPNTSEVSYAITTYYKVRSIYLLRGKYVRTSSVSADGGHVLVGYFDGDGLSVDSYWDDRRYDVIGVASARK